MVPARAGTDGKRFPDQALDHRSRGIGSGTTGLDREGLEPGSADRAPVVATGVSACHRGLLAEPDAGLGDPNAACERRVALDPRMVSGGRTPEQVNKWALRLQSGLELPGVAGPTNNLDGWQTYGAAFREAAEVVGISSGELAVRLPDDYPPSQREFDLRMGESIPDLRAGLTSLRDVLVALEWLQVEFIEHLADIRKATSSLSTAGGSRKKNGRTRGDFNVSGAGGHAGASSDTHMDYPTGRPGR